MYVTDRFSVLKIQHSTYIRVTNNPVSTISIKISNLVQSQ